MSSMPRYSDFFDFEEFHVRSGFKKEYISLWSGWLGNENIHKLDEVTKREWERFNKLVLQIDKSFTLWAPDHNQRKLNRVDDISESLSDYQESIEKESSQFSQYLIQELECVLTEEWDYTYILWYHNHQMLEALSPLVKSCNLFHFRD